MKIIKNLENFDFSQSLPIASVADLTLYYHCDSCDSLWKVFNQQIEYCKFCNSGEIEELSKEEWHETIVDQMDDTEKQELKYEKESEEDDFMDLVSLSNKYKN